MSPHGAPCRGVFGSTGAEGVVCRHNNCIKNALEHLMHARANILIGLMLCVLAAPTQAANVTKLDWGVTPAGEKVELFTLKGSGGLTAKISNYGGVIVQLLVPDRNGQIADVMLGYDDLASYVDKPNYFGVTVGRQSGELVLERGKVLPQGPDGTPVHTP